MKRNDKEAKLNANRHSLAHLLAAAVLNKFPDTKLGIGPTIEHGFYYDFKFKKSVTQDILPELEKLMRRYISAGLPLTREATMPIKARKLFSQQPFKLDLINEFAKKKQPLTIYHISSINADLGLGEQILCPKKTHASCFADLCRGGHVKNTKELDPDAFKLTHLAGAYWRGNEKGPMLTRIYGIAFRTKRELDAHLQMLEEARRRDHRKLGVALDLFTTSELIGSGLPLWTPKGTLVRDILDSFVLELRQAYGYERVDIPHITKKTLYERSGHWDKFKDELFTITTREGHHFALKPMNCPHHTQIYARKQWSYRELPQRYASTTKVYRDEQTGELAGIARVRSITQDDAHVFCRKSQVKTEVANIWNIVETFYKTFGFTLRVRLSLRDPKYPKQYLGAPKLWNEAEREMRALAKLRKTTVVESVGEAAFYGPKLDFLANDSLGRKWQLATIQLDMNMPERFGLTCTNERGTKEKIVMVHAAIMGSIERFVAILIEHYAGAFPVWLAPVQVRILAVSEKFQKYAEKVRNVLTKHEIRAELPEPDETLGKRIRQAELDRIPYTVVVGKQEMAAKTVNVRTINGEPHEATIEAFLKNIEMQILERRV